MRQALAGGGPGHAAQGIVDADDALARHLAALCTSQLD